MRETEFDVKVTPLLLILIAMLTCWPATLPAIPMESTNNQPENKNAAQLTVIDPAAREEALRKRREAYAKHLSDQGMTTPTMRETTRAAIAVGTLAEINPASGTITLAIDAEKSRLPRSLKARFTDKNKLEIFTRRQFPPRRTFALAPTTLFVDARDANRKQVPASSGNIATDQGILKLTDFSVGERVSVMFRISNSTDTHQPVRAINLSKVPADKTYFSPDFDPLEGKKIAVQRRTTDTLITSATLRIDSATTDSSHTQLLRASGMGIPPKATATPTPTPTPTPPAEPTPEPAD